MSCQGASIFPCLSISFLFERSHVLVNKSSQDYRDKLGLEHDIAVTKEPPEIPPENQKFVRFHWRPIPQPWVVESSHAKMLDISPERVSAFGHPRSRRVTNFSSIHSIESGCLLSYLAHASFTRCSSAKRRRLGGPLVHVQSSLDFSLALKILQFPRQAFSHPVAGKQRCYPPQETSLEQPAHAPWNLGDSYDWLYP